MLVSFYNQIDAQLYINSGSNYILFQSFPDTHKANNIALSKNGDLILIDNLTFFHIFESSENSTFTLFQDIS